MAESRQPQSPLNLPQAPDNVLVDPLRLVYEGEHLFQPVDHVRDGSRYMYDRIGDPLSKKLLADSDMAGVNYPMKCLPNLSVLLKMGADLNGQCELSARNPQDLIYNPRIEIDAMKEFDLPEGTHIGGMHTKVMSLIGAKPYLVHFDEPICPASALRVHHNTPVGTKICLEAEMVPGVAGFGVLFSYTCAFWLMPMFLDREERVLAELESTLRRTMLQCHETRMRETHYAAEKRQ